jgi:hypothetical protein
VDDIIRESLGRSSDFIKTLQAQNYSLTETETREESIIVQAMRART